MKSWHNYGNGPVMHHPRPEVQCLGPGKVSGKCRRKVVTESGLCAGCVEDQARSDFAVLDSYLPGGSRHTEAG